MAYEEMLAAFRRGDNVETARLARQNLDAAQNSGDLAAQVDAWCMLARVALRDGTWDRVRDLADRAGDIADLSGDDHLRRMPIHLRAVAARMAGRSDEGRRLYLRSIALNESLGEDVMAAAEHRNLAYLEIRDGNPDRARELFRESAARFAGLNAPAMTPYLTFDQATVAALDNDLETAARHLRTARIEWDRQGTVPDPDDAREVADLEQLLRNRP